jgi:hypothetical protein
MKIDYTKIWIYKLTCKDPTITDFYLGYSTRSHAYVYDTFVQRCKKDTWHVCAFIREHGGIDNFYVEKIDSIECTSSMEARTELRKHFDASPPSLNKRLPTRTHQQYAQGAKPRAVQKIYREANRERIILDQKERYQTNKEKIAIYRKGYYIQNRERVLAQVNARRLAVRASRLATPTTTPPNP